MPWIYEICTSGDLSLFGFFEEVIVSLIQYWHNTNRLPIHPSLPYPRQTRNLSKCLITDILDFIYSPR